MARPKKFTDPVSFSVHVERSTLALLDAEAKKEGVSRSAWVASRLRFLSASETPPVPASVTVSEPDTRREKVEETVKEIQKKCPHTVGRNPQGRCFACGHQR